MLQATLLETTQDEIMTSATNQQTQVYIVTFVVDGVEVSSQSVTEGDTVTRPTDPNKDGYEFVSWRSFEHGAFDFNTQIDGDLELIASFSRVENPEIYDDYWKAGPGGSIGSFTCPICGKNSIELFELYYHALPMPKDVKSQLALIVVTCSCGAVSEWTNRSNNGTTLTGPGAKPSSTNNIQMQNSAILNGVILTVEFLPGTHGSVSHNGPGQVKDETAWKSSWEPAVYPEAGYYFIGWVDQDGVPYKKNDSSYPAVIHQSYTFTAVYTNLTPYIVSYDANGGETAPVDANTYYGDETVIVSDILPVREGYTFDGWLFDDMIYQASSTFVMPKHNVSMYAQWSIRNDLEYRVEYYFDGEIDHNKTRTYTNMTYGTVINEYASKISKGFTFVTDTAPLTIGASENVIKVYYASRADLVYIVNYYYDNVIDNSKTEVVFDVTYGSIITTYEDKLEDGYVLASDTTPLHIGGKSNIINVYYVKRTDLSYSVEYYYDGELDVNRTDRFENQTFSTVITEYIDKVIDGYVLTNDTAPISIGTSENIVQVYYDKRTDLSYSVEYYYDDVIDENRTEVFENQIYGSIIEAYQDNVIEGYELTSTENLPLEIDVDQNVIKVYYTATVYTISYIMNDGTNHDSNPSIYTVNDRPIALLNPLKAGYNFEGWQNEESEIVDSIDTDSIGNRVFTAIWTAIPDDEVLQVRFVDWDGTLLGEYHVKRGTSLKAVQTPIRDGFVFSGWDSDAYLNVQKNSTITALYLPMGVQNLVNEELLAEQDSVNTITFSNINSTIAPVETISKRNIDDSIVPQASLQPLSDTWALLNLILVLATTFSSIALITSNFTNKKDDSNDKNNRKGLFGILSAALAIFAIVLFLITENLNNTMVFTDNWTLWMVDITLVQIIFSILSIRRHAEENEDQYESAGI